MKLIDKAERIITNHENQMYYDRVYFDVKEKDNGFVEMEAAIDGGPHLAKKECGTEEDIIAFIKEYNI